MADINALIAAGPHTRGVDIAGNMMKVQQLKNMQQQNQLADIQSARLQRQDERAEQDFALKLDENDWNLLHRTAKEFVGILETTGGDMKAASRAMSALPDRGRLGQMKADYFAALETPGTEDDEAIKNNALVIANMNDKELGQVKMQFSGGHTARATTKSGKQIYGEIGTTRNPSDGSKAGGFTPYNGTIDPNDPIVDVVPVGPSGLTGAEYLESQTEQIGKREEIKTEETDRRDVKKGQRDTQREAVDYGLEVADSYNDTKRAIEILESGDVETGGVAGIRLYAKQKFGIETADEAELMYRMNKAILKQLKPTFGSAFTAAEGEWLRAIEANQNKGEVGNIRVLKGLLRRQERAARRALSAAEELGDAWSASEIRAAMGIQGDGSFSGESETAKQPEYAEGTIAAHPDGRRIIFRNGKWEFLNE